MTAAIVVLSLLYEEQAYFTVPWSIFLQVINDGALASLVVALAISMLTVRIRRLIRPVSGIQGA